MDQLTKFLVRELVDGQSVTAIYGGGFKPPTKGHFDLVKTALKDFKDIDKFLIYVGGGVRDGIEQEQSIQVWDIYKELLPSKVQIEPSASPIGDILRYAKNHPDEKVYFVLGYREGREDDLQDVKNRTKGVEEKYPNIEVRVIKTPAGDMSGTNARKALQKGDKEKFFTYLPTEIPANEKEDIYKILEPNIFKEGSCGYDIDVKTGRKLNTPGGLEENDPKTGTGKKPKGSGRRLYTDEDPSDTVKVKFSTKQDIIDTLSKASFKSKSYARQSQIINLIHQRVRAAYERAKDPEVKKRLKTALDYAEQRKEASKEKTQRLKKENVAPNHTGKSSPFGSGYKPLKEGTINLSSSDQKIIDTITNKAAEKLSSGDYNDGYWLGSETYKTADGKDAEVGFYLKYDKGKALGWHNTGEEDNLKDQKIFINTAFFGPAFSLAGKLAKAATGKDPKPYLRDLIVHEFIHAKDPRANHIPLKEPYNFDPEVYYGSWMEFPTFTGGLFSAIEDSTNAFINQQTKDFNREPGELYSEETKYLSDIYQDILDYYAGYDKQISQNTLRFFERSGKNTFQKFVSSIANLLLYFVGMPTSPLEAHMSAIEAIKQYNPGGYKEFQKDLYKTIQNLIDRINSRLSPKVQKFAPVQAGGKDRLNEHSMGNSIDLLPYLAKLTQHMINKGYNIKPLPGLKLINNDVINAEKFLGKTAYYDPINKFIILYTYGRHPKDIARSYAHEMIHHIQNLEGRLGDVFTTNTLEDDHINNLEKEANLKGTMTFRNWTDGLQEEKNKDPFGLNQYARELAQGLEEVLTEGRYDKLANELSSFAFELMKDGYDVGRKVVDELFVVGPADEEVDFISDEFEFDFVVQAKYTDDTYKVDGGANAGWDKKGKPIQPLLTVRFEIPKNPNWQRVSFDLKDVVRHELEHLTQDGENVKGGTQSDDPRLVRPSKQMADDEFLRDMIDANLLPKAEYFKLEKEVDAMLQGLYFKAKKSRKPFLEVIDDYLDTQPINQEERKEILDLWAKRAKALGLPSFTSANVKETSYLHDTGVEKKDKEMRGTIEGRKPVIFCDMDGVLVDFDEGYKQLTGVTTHHADSQGKDEFWKLFRDGLKDKDISERSYWANLDWMPDGKQLWDYIKEYNPYVLTAPSVNFDIPFEERYKLENNESMQGKTEWVQRLPNMKKIYFRSAGRKADFAGPGKILIDDRKDTIDSWNANGGIGILHTSTANTIKQLQDLGL